MSVRQHHPSRTMTTPGGEKVEIDELMVSVIAELWRLGYATLRSCQDGGEATPAGPTAAEPDQIERPARLNAGRAWGTVRDDAAPTLLAVLITGTRTTRPPIDGLEATPYLTSRTLLDLTDLPQHLIVVGGGYVGCEFAQMFARFGSQVTLIQRADRLLPHEDPDISAAVTHGFTADGITVLTGTTCTAVEGRPGHVRAVCQGGETGEVTGTHLLIAVGRTPNTDALGLEHLGLTPDERGFLPVDDLLRTQAEDVWALGDIRGGLMFTHTARHDADVAYRTTYLNQERSTAGRIVPHAVFTDPEVGSVGLTEPAARAAGYEVLIGREDFAGVVKARAIGNTRGLVKFVVNAASDRILGCHIAGPDGGDLVHEAVIAMTCGGTYSDIARAIHIHPTLAEGVNSAAGGVHREIGA